MTQELEGLNLTLSVWAARLPLCIYRLKREKVNYEGDPNEPPTPLEAQHLHRIFELQRILVIITELQTAVKNYEGRIDLAEIPKSIMERLLLLDTED